MRTIVLIANLVVSLSSAIWSIVALIKPGLLVPQNHATKSDGFYLRLYVIRAIPCGLLFGTVPFFYRGGLVAWLLLCAGAIQLADAGTGLQFKNRGMMAGATLATTIHVLCAYIALH